MAGVRAEPAAQVELIICEMRTNTKLTPANFAFFPFGSILLGFPPSSGDGPGGSVSEEREKRTRCVLAPNHPLACYPPTSHPRPKVDRDPCNGTTSAASVRAEARRRALSRPCCRCCSPLWRRKEGAQRNGSSRSLASSDLLRLWERATHTHTHMRHLRALRLRRACRMRATRVGIWFAGGQISPSCTAYTVFLFEQHTQRRFGSTFGWREANQLAIGFLWLTAAV